MTKHTMKLSDDPFRATAKGGKTIEIRLNDERRTNLKAGDTIFFENEKFGSLEVKVIEIRKYKSMQDLINNEDFNKTGCLYKNIDDWIRAINTYYSNEQQSKFGLISIEIELIA